MTSIRKRSSKISLLLLGAVTLTSTGCESLGSYSSQEECQSEAETTCYLQALQRVDRYGLEQFGVGGGRRASRNRNSRDSGADHRGSVLLRPPLF